MTTDEMVASSGMRGKRYGEVLLVSAGAEGPVAGVYNTFGLNDCPAEPWSRLDPNAIAKENGALGALLNGPRYWLMDSVAKAPPEHIETKSFGGIEMMLQATVELTSMNPAPYLPNTVDRRAVFVFEAGGDVFELVDPDGRTWVMQTWSQVTDPTLSEADLPSLGSRLALPQGWTYRARTLDVELRVDTSNQPAQVLQDDLTNSYSLRTD